MPYLRHGAPLIVHTILFASPGVMNAVVFFYSFNCEAKQKHLTLNVLHCQELFLFKLLLSVFERFTNLLPSHPPPSIAPNPNSPLSFLLSPCLSPRSLCVSLSSRSPAQGYSNQVILQAGILLANEPRWIS